MPRVPIISRICENWRDWQYMYWLLSLIIAIVRSIRRPGRFGMLRTIDKSWTEDRLIFRVVFRTIFVVRAVYDDGYFGIHHWCGSRVEISQTA
jgi:hypothetical protein